MLLALSLLGGAGCGAVPSADESKSGAQASNVSLAISGGDPAQQQLLREILTSVEPPGLNSVVITAVPEEPTTAFGASGTTWLAFDYTVTDPGPAYVEAVWKAAITTTAFRRAAEPLGLPLARGFTVLGRSTDGQVVANDAVGIQAYAFETPPIADAEAVRTRLSGMAGENLSVVSVDILQPDGAAPAITLQAKDPVVFFGADSSELSDLLGDLSVYEGSLVRVLDSNGATIWIQGSANRAGHAITWSAPDFRAEG